MATESFQARRREDAGYLETAVRALRRSFFLSLTLFGVVLFGIGFSFEVLWMIGHPVENGILSAMFGIWGTTFALIGGIGYGTLRYLRKQ